MKYYALCYITPSPKGDGTYYISGRNQRMWQINFAQGKENYSHLWVKSVLPFYTVDNGDFLEGGRYYERLQTRIAEDAQEKNKPATKEGFFY
jgi:hypothetical protein